jgi:hypothetical protein
MGSFRLGPLFLTLPTLGLTGRQIILSAEQGLGVRRVGRLFAEPRRPCLGLEYDRHPVVEFGAQFVWRRGDNRERRTRSPADERQVSYNPAMAHQAPGGTRQRRGRNASRKVGLVSTSPALALIVEKPILMCFAQWG